MSLEEQVDRDFERARRRSFVAWMVARLRGDAAASGMVSFDASRRLAGADNRVYLGRRVVEVSRIVGSVGRHREFDHNFMPMRASAERWKRVDRAFHGGVDLPPVSLYQIGGDYYVHDGNHRVSVARYHGVEWIEAEVTRFQVRLNSGSSVADTRERTAA